jgi:hypothetical protein
VKIFVLVPTLFTVLMSLSAEDQPITPPISPPPPPTADPTVVPPPPPAPSADEAATGKPTTVSGAPTTTTAATAATTTGKARGNRAAAAAGRGQASEQAVSLRLTVDAGYDSNVLREDSNTPTATNTSGPSLGGELYGTWRAIRAAGGQLNVIGDMRYNAYPDESQADLGRAGVAAFGLLRFGVVDPGAVVGVSRQWLDDEGLATIWRATAIVSRLHPVREHFDSLSFDFYNVDYDDNEPASGVLSDALWRHWWMPEAGNARRRIEMTVALGVYKADAEVESYSMFKPGLSALYRVGDNATAVGIWDMTAQTSYEWRDYDATSGATSEKQHLFQIGGGADRWFGEMLAAGLFVTYSIRESNQVGNDYDRVQVGVRLRADW